MTKNAETLPNGTTVVPNRLALNRHGPQKGSATPAKKNCGAEWAR
jgi:hypothetical protein